MECPSLHPDDLMRMPKGKLVKAFIAMAGELAEVKLLNLAFAQQIEELLRSAGKTSRNSGLPPSSDGLSKPTVEEVSEKRARSLRGKSNRDPRRKEVRNFKFVYFLRNILCPAVYYNFIM